MRRIIILSICLFFINCFAVIGLSQVNDSNDDRSEEEVKQLIVKLINNKIDIPETVTLEYKLHKLGDRGVKILVKQIDKATLNDSKFITNVFIPVVRYSFAKPNEIETEFDKLGVITLLSMQLIIDNSKDITIKEKIQRLKFIISPNIAD